MEHARAANRHKGSVVDYSLNGGMDRLSSLPEDLLLYIFTFLSMKEVVSTSILSRRWRHLRTKMIILDFTSYKDRSLIDRILIFHKGSKIQTFKVEFDYEDRTGSNLESYDNAVTRQLNSWVYFAISRQVEDLSLMAYSHKLPEYLFRCSSVKELELGCRWLNLPNDLHLESLTTLTLSRIQLSGSEITCLTSGCPVIKNLILDHCNHRSKLSIFVTNPSLMKLAVIGLDIPSEIVINARHLSRLLLHGSLRETFVAKNLSALVFLSFSIKSTAGNGFVSALIRLLNSLQPVILRLCRFCISSIFRRWENNHPLTSLKTKYLYLTSGLSPIELRCIARFFTAFPNLSYLKISIIQEWLGPNMDNCGLTMQEMLVRTGSWQYLESSTPSGKSLENIEIDGFLDASSLMGNEDFIAGNYLTLFMHEIELVRIFLGFGGLQKMILRTKKPQTNKIEVLHDVTKKLLSLPRASPKLQFHFY